MDSRCEICPGRYACIPSDGPMDASVYLIGERPGQWEEANARKGYGGYGQRRCFVGPTGAELNDNYLGLAGIHRDNVRCSNTVRCGADRNKKPADKEIDACAGHFLKQDIEAVNPKVVVLMGATACANFHEREIDLDVEHGIPFWGRLWEWEGWIVPHYHPALGLHSTGMMTYLLEDWERLGEWLKAGKERMWPIEHTQPPKKLDYRLVQSSRDLKDYFLHYNAALISIDTESHAGTPWSIQVSLEPNTGRMVLLKDVGLARELGNWINEGLGFNDAKLVFHNAPADLEITEKLSGFKLEGSYRDTMQEAYGFGNMRQSLKALGYGLFGIRMKSWENLVLPYSKDKLKDQMIEALIQAEQKPDVTYKQLKTKMKEVHKPSYAESKLRWIINHTKDGADYDPWEKLAEWEIGKHLDGMGIGVPEWIQKGIANVPLEEAVRYGCQDADVTLQAAMEFDRMRPRVEEGWGVAEYDYDK